MDIDILAVGDEVLYGYTGNSNASFIAQNLLENGLLPSRHLVVGDNEFDVHAVLQQALEQGRIVIITGGLGPTVDDLTRKILANLFGVPLVAHESLRAHLEKISCTPDTIEDQMIQPQGAILLENRIGTASGLILENPNLFGDALVIAMPGIPTEMKQMFKDRVLGYLIKRCKSPTKCSVVKIMHFVGLIENQLNPILQQIKSQNPHIGCGIYPQFSSVTVQLRSFDAQELELASKPFVDTFKNHIFSSPSGTIAEAVHLQLLKQKMTLAIAESCTGGALAYSLVENPDASAYLLGGIVAYSNEAKENLLGVEPEVLEKYGAVSQEVTDQMAQGASKKLKAKLGISVSGILGPSGGTAAKPVGTVAASIVYQGKVVLSWTMHLKGTRQHLIKKVVDQILAKLYFFLREQEKEQK